MNCRTFHENLEDYLEGGLDFAGRFGMERHAQQCFACGKTVADAQKLSQLTRDFKRVGAPVGFEAAVLQRIQKEAVAQTRWRLWHVPVIFFEWATWRSVAVGVSALTIVGFLAFFAARWAKLDGSTPAAIATNDVTAISAPQHVVAERLSSATNDLPNPAPKAASAEESVPVRESVVRAKGALSTEDGFLQMYSEQSETEYVEYLVPGPGNRQYVMRLPKTIRMRYGQPSEEYFIRNVSH